MERIIEKLQVSYLLKKFPMFFCNRRIHYWFPKSPLAVLVNQTNQVNIYPVFLSSVLILSSHLRNGLNQQAPSLQTFSSAFHLSSLPCVQHALPIAHFVSITIIIIGETYNIWILITRQFSSASCNVFLRDVLRSQFSR